MIEYPTSAYMNHQWTFLSIVTLGEILNAILAILLNTKPLRSIEPVQTKNFCDLTDKLHIKILQIPELDLCEKLTSCHRNSKQKLPNQVLGML